MPRDLPLGNGSLLVNFDPTYQLRDIYWPHVGQENHTAGHTFRFGVWADGVFRWLDAPRWERRLLYLPNTLVSEVTLRHPDLQLSAVCRDLVDFHEDLYLRELRVKDEAGRPREVRLFFSHDFHIGGHEIGDTAYYEPERRAVFHYKGPRWFLINAGKSLDGNFIPGVDQWAVGIKEAPGKEGTWRDAEDGLLSGNAVSQGSVDSTIAIHLSLPSGGESVAWYWIAMGKDFAEVTRLNRAVRAKGPHTFVERTRYYWKLWVSKEHYDCSPLPGNLRALHHRSLLLLRSQIDDDGAILAATDFDISRYGKDTYSYMWPRDGALVAAALINAGYSEVSRHFFNFCHRVITEEGYLLHKYNPDGSLGSSWHGWLVEGKKEVPLQEDETALCLWALWRHFQRFRDVEFVKPLYRGFVIRAANWMTDYIDEETGLPLPSWDLWEERRGVHAWTVAAVWAGLQAAAEFADAFGEHDLAKRYRQAADKMRQGAEARLWSQEEDRFLRTVNPLADEPDKMVDASLCGLWYFGLFPADDPRIAKTMQAVRARLWVKTNIGGLARYERDLYQQVSDDRAVPGNPWFICTLWLAQWHIAAAKSVAELQPAKELLDWAASHACASGVMAEQIHPYTGEPVSVCPLTWSHATFVLALQEYLERLRQLQ